MLQQLHQPRTVTFSIFQSLSVIRVDYAPLDIRLYLVTGGRTFMDKVAPLSKTTIALLSKRMTSLCLVGPVMLHVNFEFLGTMGELASTSIRALPPLHEVFAERTLGFGAALLD